MCTYPVWPRSSWLKWSVAAHRWSTLGPPGGQQLPPSPMSQTEATVPLCWTNRYGCVLMFPGSARCLSSTVPKLSWWVGALWDSHMSLARCRHCPTCCFSMNHGTGLRRLLWSLSPGFFSGVVFWLADGSLATGDSYPLSITDWLFLLFLYLMDASSGEWSDKRNFMYWLIGGFTTDRYERWCFDDFLLLILSIFIVLTYCYSTWSTFHHILKHFNFYYFPVFTFSLFIFDIFLLND